MSKVQAAGELADDGGEAEAAPPATPQQQVPQQQVPVDPSQVPQDPSRCRRTRAAGAAGPSQVPQDPASRCRSIPSAAGDPAVILPFADVPAPEIDYEALSPLMAMLGGSVVVLMVGLVRGRAVQRVLVPALTAVSLLTAIGLSIWIWEPGDQAPTVAGALTADTLAVGVSMLFYVAGLFAVLLSLRATAVREAGARRVPLAAARLDRGHGGAGRRREPDRVLRRARAAVDPAVRAVRHRAAARAPRWSPASSTWSSARWARPRCCTGLPRSTAPRGTDLLRGHPAARSARTAEWGSPTPCCSPASPCRSTGLAFKASVAPFHQWTPDVYQGAPTPITSFMAVATKAAAFAIFLRFFDDTLINSQVEWAPRWRRSPSSRSSSATWARSPSAR